MSIKRLFALVVLGACMPIGFRTAAADSTSGVYFESDGVSYAIYDWDNVGRVATVVARTGGYSGEVTLPENVTYNGVDYAVARIDDQAFEGSTGLVSIHIPATMRYIGDYAFQGCTSLQAVHIYNMSAWCRIDFLNNPLLYAHNLYLNGQLVRQLQIPSDISSLPSMAFMGADCLQSVVFPASMTSIGASAFSMCHGLTQLVVPDAVTTIGNSAFYQNTSLTHVWLPTTLRSLGSLAFSGCSALEEMCVAVNYGTLVTRGSQIFSSSGAGTGTLYVPTGSLSTYQSKDEWEDWGTIVEAEECGTPDISMSGSQLLFTCDTPGALINASVTSPDFGTYTAEAPVSKSLKGRYDVVAQATAPQKLESPAAMSYVFWSLRTKAVTGAPELALDEPSVPLLVKVQSGQLVICGTATGQCIAIYGFDGSLLHRQPTTDGSTTLTAALPSAQPVILVYDNHAFKLLTN